MRKALVTLIVLVATGAAAPVSAQVPTWRLEQPPPPEGAPFKVPLGVPGDLDFWAPNRGLLAIEGNDTVPRGLLYYNGTGWRQLATVCGGTGDTTQIVWAGPTEFWTITSPSRPRSGAGRALCRFSGGQVVGSYSTADGAQDPFRQMTAGACNGPTDCWFGGVADTDGTGARVGGFHLHWDGTELRSVYAPQGRAVSDMTFAFGGLWESTLAGARPSAVDPPLLAKPDPPGLPPRLVHVLSGPNFVEDPYAMPQRDAAPAAGIELLGTSFAESDLWMVGGGAASGPAKPQQGSVVTTPFAAVRTGGDGFHEVPIDGRAFDTDERFVDVAAVGGGAAWAAVQALSDARSTNARARVARISADGATTVTTLPASGSGRGSAARIEFTSPTEGWMVTSGGWLFHYTDGTPLPQDTDPAFQNLIDFRPNEAAEQFVPDDPPTDDSRINAPAPVSTPKPKPPKTIRKKLKPLLKNPRTKLKGLVLTIRFALRRPAKVAVLATLKGKTVARSKLRKLPKGKHAVRLKLNPDRYPDGLEFVTREPGLDGSGGGGDGNVVTTR